MAREDTKRKKMRKQQDGDRNTQKSHQLSFLAFLTCTKDPPSCCYYTKFPPTSIYVKAHMCPENFQVLCQGKEHLVHLPQEPSMARWAQFAWCSPSLCIVSWSNYYLFSHLFRTDLIQTVNTLLPLLWRTKCSHCKPLKEQRRVSEKQKIFLGPEENSFGCDSPAPHKPAMVTHTCNSRGWGRKIRSSRFSLDTIVSLSQPGLHMALSQKEKRVADKTTGLTSPDPPSERPKA